MSNKDIRMAQVMAGEMAVMKRLAEKGLIPKEEAMTDDEKRIAALEAEVATLDKETDTLIDQLEDLDTAYNKSQKVITGLQKQLAECQMERDRLLVLAIKYCDKGHHDWDEVCGFDTSRIAATDEWDKL